MDKTHYTPHGRHSQPAPLAWYARAMSKTLIETWLAAEYAAGKNKTEATAALNKATGKRYTLHRVLEWEKEERDVPAAARAHMLRVALPAILEASGLSTKDLTPSALRRLADRLS